MPVGTTPIDALHHPAALVALLAWFPLALTLFFLLPARSAMLATLLAGFMFLPIARIPVAGLPDYSKTVAVTSAALLGVLVRDRRRLMSLRPSWADFPMALWCLSPAASSFSNHLGAHDAAAVVVDQAVCLAVPYVLGRTYAGSVSALRTLAVGLVIAGLVYTPLCWFEMMHGPVLHQAVYGYRQSDWTAAIRFGGWRPIVFMPNGLVTAMWMFSSALAAFGLWSSGARSRLLGAPMAVWMAVLFATTLATRSVNAVMLLIVGTSLLMALSRRAGAALLLCVLLAPVLYVATRAASLWPGTTLTRVALHAVGVSRAQSLQFRLQQENALARKARQRPWLGWGRWGRARVADAAGNDISTTDSIWIITFGDAGTLGLIGLFGVLLLPVAVVWMRWPLFQWTRPTMGAAAALAVMLLMYAFDACLNSDITPVTLFAAGALTTFGRRPNV